MTVTIIDCYDSFTYNLYQLVGSLGEKVVAITCDEPLAVVEATDPTRIILSPGPGTPADSGICRAVIERYAGEIPILGVCLGHQTIVETFGGKVVRMTHPVHGKTCKVSHTDSGLFNGVTNPFTATRYHSLMADPTTFPSSLEITARSQDDHCIMAIAHKKYPIYGVQFHPESIMTPAGREILAHFTGREEAIV